jgi:FkbM family methyltransferase
MTVAALIPVGPVTVRLISDGDRIVGSLKERGPFEPDSLAKWAELCAGGGTVVDVGAYTGLYTISARLLGCRTIAFEPMIANRARLQENARLNNVSDKVNSEAVSDDIGVASLAYNPIPFTSGASLLRRKGVHIEVPVLTIDSLNLPKVDAIKIDVERAEPRVLAGARETLARCKPVLLVEVLGKEEGLGVLAAVEGYRHVATLDVRNWLMLPK